MLLNQRIAGFDGIRALAVIFVVLQHLGIWGHAAEAGFVARRVLPLVSGTTAVQAFFILSGFLITILLIKEKRTTGKISIAAFMVRRSLRIFPLYLLFCLLATLALVFLNGQLPGRALAYAFLYAYNFVPMADYLPLLGHTWSLAVEEHFYLIWPLVFALGYVNRSRGLLLGLCAFVIGSLLLHAVLIRQPFAADYAVARWSFLAGYNIALGCIGALLVTGSMPKENGVRLFAGSGAFLLGVLLYANTLYIDSSSWFVQNVLCGYIRAVGILLMILWIYLNQASTLVRVLEVRPLRYLGTISYGIYMWQGLFLSTGPRRLAGEMWPPSPATGLMMLAIVAPLSYRYFEQPFLEWKKRYARAAERQGTQAVPEELVPVRAEDGRA